MDDKNHHLAHGATVSSLPFVGLGAAVDSIVVVVIGVTVTVISLLLPPEGLFDDVRAFSPIDSYCR